MSQTSKLSFRIALVEDHARMASLVQRGMAASGVAVDILLMRRPPELHALQIVGDGRFSVDGEAIDPGECMVKWRHHAD